MLLFPQIVIAIIFLTIILLLCKRQFKQGDTIAFIFLFFIGISMFIKLINIGALKIALPSILLSINSFPLTYGPLLYFYIKFEISEKPGFKKVYLLHFLPFILFTIIPFSSTRFMPLQYVNIFERQINLVLDMEPTVFSEQFVTPPTILYPPENHPDMPIPKLDPKLISAMYIHYITILISFIIYSIFCLYLFLNQYLLKKGGSRLFAFRFISSYLNNSKRNFKYDAINSKNNLLWLKILTLSFVVSYLFAFITVYIFYNKVAPFTIRIIPDLAYTFFTFIFCFLLIRRPDVLKKLNKINNNFYNASEKNKKYAKSGLTEELEKNYLLMLDKYMTTEKPYLNSDLSIEDVSKKLGIPRHYLTQTINERLNKNFYTYINEFRIKEAQRMLADQNFKDFTIIRIAYAAGFNTKAGFNLIFKKLTGFTPSEYRKNSLLNANYSSSNLIK